MLPVYVLPFVVYGITYILRYLDGFFEVFEKIRNLFGVYKTLDGKFTSNGSQLSLLYSCFWCLGTWVSIIVSIVYIFFGDFEVIKIGLLTFFCIGLAGILHDWMVLNE